MYISMSCSDKIFRSAHSAYVTDTNHVITDSNHVALGDCGVHSKTTLSDLVLAVANRHIPSWAWTTHYLVNVDGYTYVPRMAGKHLYIPGLHVLPEYVHHLTLSLLYVPFAPTRISLKSTDVAVPTSLLTNTIELPFTGTVDRVVMFLAGHLVHQDNLVSDGTTLTITLTAAMLASITAPTVRFVYPTITTVGELLNHPGSSMLIADKDLTFTFEAVGVSRLATSAREPVYGPPTLYGALAYGEAGEVLPYIYKSTARIRARFCSPEIHTWLIIQ